MGFSTPEWCALSSDRQKIEEQERHTLNDHVNYLVSSIKDLFLHFKNKSEIKGQINRCLSHPSNLIKRIGIYALQHTNQYSRIEKLTMFNNEKWIHKYQLNYESYSLFASLYNESPKDERRELLDTALELINTKEYQDMEDADENRARDKLNFLTFLKRWVKNG